MSQHLEKNTTFVAAEDLSACNKLKLITSIIIKCMIFLIDHRERFIQYLLCQDGQVFSTTTAIWDY